MKKSTLEDMKVMSLDYLEKTKVLASFENLLNGVTAIMAAEINYWNALA